VIIYASTRFGVERLARRLARAGIRAAAYHGGLADQTRRSVQEAFMSSAIDIIVATNAFGMGIDKPNVRLVVHYSMPGTLEAYYQEAGRAGRDGKPSRCILMHSSQDRITHEWFIHGMYPERSLVEREYAAIISSHRDGVVTRRPSGRAQMAAHRLLLREGVLTSAPCTATTSIRLLATPARIKRELPLVERALLRELWRASAGGFEQGADVDLSSIRSTGTWRSRVHLLESLRQRQFIDFMFHSADLLLARPDATLDSFPIDWEALERRMTRDIEKLDAMQNYARTAHCRREFVLRYFGDEAARPSCGACDNCLAQ
jgi:ATP-dependent DNA helicase RecQ